MENVEVKPSRLTLFKPDTVLGYYANSADPVQTPPNAASDQGLHCLFTDISMQYAKIRNGLVQLIRLIKSIGQKSLNGKTKPHRKK